MLVVSLTGSMVCYTNSMEEQSIIKHGIYLVSTTILGVLLSFLAHAALEILYINLQESRKVEIVWHKFLGFGGLCALPVWLEYVLLLAGILFGYWLGRVWWRIVYIEHRRWKTRMKSLLDTHSKN